MTSSIPDSSLVKASDLLAYYSYETGNQSQENLLDDWLRTYPAEWVRLALIEALFRGRYKTISVDGLLADWERRGQPYYHFNREFEALICHNFPKLWLNLDSTPKSEHVSVPTVQSIAAKKTDLSISSVNDRSTETDDPNAQDDPADLLAWSPKSDTFNLSLSYPSPDTDQFLEQESNTSPYKISSVQEDLQKSNNVPDQHYRSRVKLATRSRRLAVLPIHQFTPEQKSSEHYRKLVAIVSEQSII